MKSDSVYPAARALAAIKHGGDVSLDSLSMNEEVGFMLLGAAVRALVRGG